MALSLLICFSCKEIGHTAQHCPKKGKIHAYARIDHRMRQVLISFQVSEIASIVPRRKHRFTEPVVEGHNNFEWD